MSNNSEPPVKKLKKDAVDSDEGRDFDTQKALEEIDACQNKIDALNEKASEDILRVEQKYNKLRKPFFEKRNQIIKGIPNFWITAFVNHPQMTTILDEEEEDCLRYLSKVEVEEFEDIKFGYKINFFFDSNPFLENSIITKEFHLGAPVPCTKSTQILWKDGHNLLNVIRDRYSQKHGRRRGPEKKTFFTWFVDNCDPSADDIAEVIKDDLWPNPLQYYLVPDVDENGIEVDDDYDKSRPVTKSIMPLCSDDEADDSVVVVEEVDDDDNDNNDEEDEDYDEDVIIDDDDNDNVKGEILVPDSEEIDGSDIIGPSQETIVIESTPDEDTEESVE